MNFEEWYNVPGYRNSNIVDAKKGWDACKKEVLNIINCPDNAFPNHWAAKQRASIKEKIEKL